MLKQGERFGELLVAGFQCPEDLSFPSISGLERRCRLWATDNERTASEIKGLERGGQTIHSVVICSLLKIGAIPNWPCSRILVGKICRPATPANSTLGSVPVVFLSQRAICTQKVSTKDTVQAWSVRKRGLLCGFWPPTGEVKVSCLAKPGAQQA